MTERRARVALPPFFLGTLLWIWSGAGCVPPPATPVVPAAPEATVDGGGPLPIPTALLEPLVEEAARVRQLAPLRPIVGLSMTDEQIREHIRSQVASSDMRAAERVMRAFGFLPEEVRDLETLLVTLLGDEVVGLYDPREEQLIVRREVARALGSNSGTAREARAVLVHEIVHALQDQHFETLSRTSEDAWGDDALSALDCLAEGDATLAMIVDSLEAAGLDHALTLLPEFGRVVRELGRTALPESEALAQAPPYFGHVMGSTYFEGAAFAAELRRRGGWEAVDRAHRLPPASTREILHPEVYLEGTMPVLVDLPESFQGLAEPDYVRVRAAVLGELETGAFLLPLGDLDRATSAAAGWAGDHFAVYESPAGALVLVWRLVFVDEDAAAEFATAARDALEASGRGPCEAAEDGFACRQGADRVARRGLDLAVVRGGPPEHAAAIAEALLAAPARAQPPRQPG